MKRLAWFARALVSAFAFAMLVQTAGALERNQSYAGIVYMSGGIGLSERAALHAARERYSLWVTTVAKGSGAYLSDARLRIVSLDGRRVLLDDKMSGPWLFAALPPGRYEVSATLRAEGADSAETITRQLLIRPGDHRQAVLRFVSSADVGPEREHPFNGNPFGYVAPAQ